MSAIQHSQELKAYYMRKTAEGKNEMLVINNICNKLIHRVYACVERKEKYKDLYSPAVAWIIEIGLIVGGGSTATVWLVWDVCHDFG